MENITDYFMHVQTVSTRPLLQPGDEAMIMLATSFSHNTQTGYA